MTAVTAPLLLLYSLALVVFCLYGIHRYWMVVDNWEGLGVYRSADGASWERQPENLLAAPGTGEDDRTRGHHADVVVSGGRAFVFYFTHPGRRPGAEQDGYEQRRSSIQVAELTYTNGWLTWINITWKPPGLNSTSSLAGTSSLGMCSIFITPSSIVVWCTSTASASGHSPPSR